MNYWNIELYGTKFTKIYNTVVYVKSDSIFMQLNIFQCNIKFIVESKKGKILLFSKVLPAYPIYKSQGVSFSKSNERNLLLKSNQNRNLLELEIICC